MSRTASLPPTQTDSRLLPSQRVDAIRVQGLSHYFGEGEIRKQVLFDNDLEVGYGEIVIMTGPSGSGKTTLLTLIGTLRTVQQGSLQVLGRQLAGVSADDRIALRRNIGFIFQAHNLFDSLTAYQNVRMGLELFGFSPAEIKQRADADFGPRRLGTPSALQARLAVGRTKAAGGRSPRPGPRPQASTGRRTHCRARREIGTRSGDLFQELVRKEHCTIVIVTHDNRILDVADRIVSMVNGRIKSNVFVRECVSDLPISLPLSRLRRAHAADTQRDRRSHAGGNAPRRRHDHPPGRPGRQVLRHSPRQRGGNRRRRNHPPRDSYLFAQAITSAKRL